MVGSDSRDHHLLDFENHWRPNKVVELNTIRMYDGQYNCRNWGLKGYWGNVELRRITRTSVQTWVARMRKADLTSATIEARFKAFQTILAGGTWWQRSMQSRRGSSVASEDPAGMAGPG